RRHTRFSRDWSSDVCSSDLSSFNRRWASYYIRSQVTWRKNGSKYHDFDMWWNDKVDFIVSRERTDIIGRGLWAYRVNDIHFRLRSEERRVGKDGSSRWRAE